MFNSATVVESYLMIYNRTVEPYAEYGAAYGVEYAETYGAEYAEYA